MFTTGENVGLPEWIIDDTLLDNTFTFYERRNKILRLSYIYKEVDFK